MAEQRCTDLGSDCVCSEPLQATSYPEDVSNDFKNPNDTSSQQCSQDGVSGGAITRTADDVVANTDATALAALPAGHSVARFLSASNNHEGTFMVGHNGSVSSSKARVAARWYIYRTPTYDFASEGSCINSKIAQFDNAALIDWNGTNFHTYGYTTFSPSEDCCLSGPGPDYGSISTAEMKGKWWMCEIVLTNRAGPDYRMQMYMRNVTDDGSELEPIDIWSANYSSASSDKLFDVNLTPPSLMSGIFSNNHRFSNGNICRGWVGISHYMYAAWDTDAGQRIGAASEIEGGTPDTTPPTLSSPSAGTPTSIGTTNASVSTDEGNGVLYRAGVTNGGSCTAAQLKAGLGGNIVAASAGNQAVSGTGAQVIATIIGLAPSTLYQIKFLQTDNAGNDSAQASVNLTTAAGSGRTAKRAQYARRRE